jgi:phosphoribosylamine--glycine ligase
MKILIVGSGGREHTLAWKVSQSKLVKKIYCAPGNAGTSGIAENVSIKADDISGLRSFAKENKIDLTIVGPEIPLVAGIVDEFEKDGLKIFGPRKAAAALEGSKVFSKEFMLKYGIPTAPAKIFSDEKKAIQYIKDKNSPLVVKADGLAAGKGVIVCNDVEEAEEAVHRIMVKKEFGEAGGRVVIEECLFGEEASIIAITDGETIIPLATSQDHKRAFDNDKGPNTGGMGAYSPAPVVTPELLKRIDKEILQPTVSGLKKEKLPFKGVVYVGVMVTKDGPKVLEYNARFGDPETQAILPRMESDIVEVISAAVNGRLSETKIKWKDKAAVCVVMASGGYPGSYEKGKEISGLDKASALLDTVVFHAGTKSADGRILTSGGRVLGVTALGQSIKSAIENSYKAVKLISFDGAHYRSDIGRRAL